MAITSVSTKLEVGIVGAGIAGLSAAIGLSRAGHTVEIFEKSTFANELGAAIHICPNASRILRRWGFDFVRANAVLVEAGRVMDGNSMRPSYSATYEGLVDQFGAPWYFLHRVDLHNELKRLVQQSGDGFQPASIRLLSEVVEVDCENGEARLKDGTVIRKDLIIAANGIHSSTASLVNGMEIPAAETGHSAFRFLIPTQRLVDAGLGDALFVNSASALSICTDEKRRLVWYPCRLGQLQNFVGIHPSRKQSTDVEEWNVGANTNDLVDEYKSFHPDIVKACELAEDLKLWKLLYRSPIEQWYKGKVALAGDAAHPMLPHQGQGAAQAIEDGAALGTLFTGVSLSDDVTSRLKMYQDIRQRRAAAIQIFSNAGQDQAEKIKEDARKFVKGLIPRDQAGFHKFNFEHDVVAVCREALKAAPVGESQVAILR